MPPTLQNIASNVRIRLGDPLAQRPSLRQTLRYVADAAQMLFNQANSSGKAWAVGECQLNVTSNTTDYVLPVGPEFGKPLSVLTLYQPSQSYIPRYVNFFEINDLYFDWGLPANLASYIYTYDGSPNTAARIAFYKKPNDPSQWVRVLPMPALSAQYLVTFSTGDWVDSVSLDNSPLLSQFSPLIEMNATEALLSLTSWYSEKADEKLNQDRRKEIIASMARMRQGYEDEFDRFIRSTTDPGLSIRNSSIDEMSSGIGGGWS